MSNSNSRKNRSRPAALIVPVAKIRGLRLEVERTHDAYWFEEYNRASPEANLRRNDWTRAIHEYETALKAYAPALLEAYERGSANHNRPLWEYGNE